MPGKIFKNSSYLLAGQALIKVVAFLYTIFLARNLGVYNFGLYVTALAYFSLISSVADLGFNRFLIREGSRNSDRLHIYLCNTILARLTITSVVLAIFSIWIYSFDKNSLRVSLSLLAALAVLPQSIALTLDAAFVVKQKLQYSALGLIVMSVLGTLIGGFLVSTGFSTCGAVAGLVAGQLIYMLFLLWLIYHQKINFVSQVTWQQLKEITKGSLPYGILVILGLLYFRIDTLFLSYLKGPEQAGIYGAAYRFLEALVFIPSAVATAMFPVAAKLHDSNLAELKKLYFNSIKALGLVSLVILIGYLLVLPIIIRLVLPNFLPAITVIQILSLAIPFMFIHVPGSLVLISTDKFLKPVILLSIVTLAFNVITNLIFIPNFGIIAAAWVTVASEVLSFVVFFLLLYYKLLKNA